MGRFFRLAAIPASLLALSASSVYGQVVMSARSGLVHYVEGQVTLDDKSVDVKYSQFPEVRDNQVLKTEEGRAEVLLTPGVILRLAENSSFRMLSNRLADTRVQVLSGSLMIEHGEIFKDNQVTVVYKDRTVNFLKSGLYRLDAENGTLRVYQGEAKVISGEQSMVAKQSHEISLEAAVLTSMKFDAKSDDEFYRWASRRAGYLAMANVSAAKSMHDSGSYSSAMASGQWSYNPWFGMYTYVPMGGIWNSPFGYAYYSPFLISRFYNYYPGYYGYGNGYGYYGGNNNYYNNGGTGGGGTASNTRGRFDSANSYSVPSRPANNSSPSFANRGGFDGGGRSFGGGAMSAGGGGSNSGGGYSGGGSAVSSGGGGGGAPSGSVSRGGGASSGGGSAGGRGR